MGSSSHPRRANVKRLCLLTASVWRTLNSGIKEAEDSGKHWLNAVMDESLQYAIFTQLLVILSRCFLDYRALHALHFISQSHQIGYFVVQSINSEFMSIDIEFRKRKQDLPQVSLSEREMIYYEK